MRKTYIIVIGIFLAAALLLAGACGSDTPLKPPSVDFTRTFYVPLTGVHMESFNFKKGDNIEGKLTADGKFTIDLSVTYSETPPEGGKSYESLNRVLETGEIMEKNFSFVAPVSSEYVFLFSGFYADNVKAGKDYEGLHQTVSLDITVNP